MAVQRGILLGDLEGSTRAVDAGDVRAAWGEMKREPALVAEDVERVSRGVLGRGE